MSKTHATDELEAEYYGHLHVISHEPGTLLHEEGTIHPETQEVLDGLHEAIDALKEIAGDALPEGFSTEPNPLQGKPGYMRAIREKAKDVDVSGMDRKGLAPPPKRY